MSHVIVIGAGQAAASLVAKLRSKGFNGKITVIGAEETPPYQRPPLSKAYLLGDMALDKLYLRPRAYYADQDINLHLGQAVSSVDTKSKSVFVGDGLISYDELVFITGSEPLQLSAAIGGALAGVYTIRGLSDVDCMAPEITEGKHVLIVGGGYIGLEAAAVAAKKGLKVTLVEMATVS